MATTTQNVKKLYFDGTVNNLAGLQTQEVFLRCTENTRTTAGIMDRFGAFLPQLPGLAANADPSQKRKSEVSVFACLCNFVASGAASSIITTTIVEPFTATATPNPGGVPGASAVYASSTVGLPRNFRVRVQITNQLTVAVTTVSFQATVQRQHSIEV